MSRRLALLVNPAASGGRARATARAAGTELERLGADHRLVETENPDHARAAARAAAEAGEVVVAVGGDGLVGTLAGAVRDSGALAIVPAGRGNDFARVLGIPREPAAAARVALEGEERPIDLAAANGRPFVGIASVGFDSEANRLANEARLVRGNLVYLYATLRALATWQPASFTVTVDGERHTTTGYTVAVANSKAYGGGMYLVPHAELDDGRLDVIMSGASTKRHCLRVIPRAFNGTHVTDPMFAFLGGETVEIDADRQFTVYADGDPIAELPVTVTVERRLLRVVAPAR